MNYQEFSVINQDGTVSFHIQIEVAPDEYKSFPTDPQNPEYAAFLETADGEAYLEAQATPSK